MISLTSPVETRAHGWPASAKLGALCAVSVWLFAVDALAWHVCFLAGVLTLYALPGKSFLRVGLGRLWLLWPFVLLILIWHALTDDLVPGLVIVLRMIAAVGLANLVTMTTRLSDMIAVVQWLAAPLRVFGLRPAMIAMAIALVIRFTPVLVARGQMLALAWRARSRCRPGWRIVLPFAVTAIDDAEQVAEALRARGGL